MRDLSTLVALAERGKALRASTPLSKRSASAYLRISAAKSGRTALHLYDAIGEWGVPAREFVAELAGVTGGVDLHLNSPGGDVFDGIAMHAALVNRGDVNVFVDGIAASAASFLAMAGDEITIEKPAKMMIHNASGIVLGNKRDMREMADILDGIDATIAEIYADRTGRPAREWAAAMDSETWYSSAQAVDAGLADRVANDSKAKAPEDRRTQLIRARARVALRGA
jgi:ATP-dependent protease ClpP protease subunit